MTALVIVESPAKAKTIAGYLGDGYVVESSIGHVRDLPQGASDIPAAYKGEKWARLGIDVDNGFKPLYVINRDKKDQIRKLKSLLSDADELLLATDEDREGEAIAWHLLEVLNPQVPVKRMVFHEITPDAIREAVDNPRELDRRLVDAQEARRMLDRLYGFEVSPVLWKKVMPRLSAGRVQSVATRIVVERERERMAFVAAGYWDLKALFSARGEVPAGEPRDFRATLTEVDGSRVASGRDFDQQGQLVKTGAVVIDQARAQTLASALEGVDFEVLSVEPKPYRRRPAAPFMTSTFQQEAGRKLRMSSAVAMRAAQGLYEKGLITYMRTDSTTLSGGAIGAARSHIEERYGRDFLPDAPRQYTKKVKNAQEAHEAIRPAGDRFRAPDDVAREVSRAEAEAYDLIFKRTIASQMTDAQGETVAVRLGADTTAGEDVQFSASGTVISHQGFRRVYVEDADGGESDSGDDRRLPPLAVGDGVDMADLEAEGHETQSPARYTEASLVKRLEELGVGRPSTYASIMGTIQDRGYVWKKGSALVPSFTAFSVVGLLEGHFPNLIDYAFTARMEDDLDKIAMGTSEAVPWLDEFYFGGDDDPGLKAKVETRLGEIDAAAINSIPLGVAEDGEPVIVRVGRYGPFVQRGDDTASVPEDLPPDELTVERALEFIDAPSNDRLLGTHPEVGLEIFVKAGRFGPYVQMGEHDDDTGEKPRTASLLASMDPVTVDLATAVKLLSLPRVVGIDPADGQEITVHNGRYGPYLQKLVVDHNGQEKKDSRSLTDESQLFTVTLEECLAMLAQPKRGRGQQAKPDLRELGDDPESGKPMVLKDGRFGPYVTDGEYNASLRKADTVEELTVERAAELLADRRAKGPAKGPAKKKTKAAKKTAPKKKTAKKAASKKKPAKKQSTKKKAAAKSAGSGAGSDSPAGD